jgi:hypothetical protein
VSSVCQLGSINNGKIIIFEATEASMNAELRKKREELEKKLEYAQNAHMAYAKGIGSESAYRDSYQKVREIRDELYMVAMELGDPIPFRMEPK